MNICFVGENSAVGSSYNYVLGLIDLNASIVTYKRNYKTELKIRDLSSEQRGESWLISREELVLIRVNSQYRNLC